MLSQENEAQIIALCERTGMPWERAPRRQELDHAWYGFALNLGHVTPNGTSDLVHDVAHWLIAAPERRSDPYFGLDSMAYWFTPESDAPDDTEEEMQVSLLGFLLERALGMNWRYTWEFHSWEAAGWAGLRPVIRALRQRGLIQGLTPTCLLNSAG